MRVSIKILLLSPLGALMFSGCTPGYRVDADMLQESKQTKGMRVTFASSLDADKATYRGYQNSDNAKYKCSYELAVHAIATKALENGYPYFSVEYPQGSNSNPMAIVTANQGTRYCVAPYYDSESSLLDDKCGHIGLGNGTPSGVREMKAYYFKKRNPIMPLWDARKTKRDTEKTLMYSCFHGDRGKFKKTLQSYHKFGNRSID